ncbi:MAG: PadR family transcriptional regulator [Streptosporangiales bacterium]|nr:PadR family transcriptional regulator [Streptosporangiales bacterium]
MSSVFGHGRLRLYLLKLLDEEPRHGYDIIRLLEDRFMGVYAPSAGTIYPRLNRLEEEGLVEHEVTEGKKVYRLTDAGRAELAARQEEIAALEQDIDRSVRDLAREVREDVRSSVRGLREELKAAAREVRNAEHDRKQQGKRPFDTPWEDLSDVPGWSEAKEAVREAKRAFREGTRSWQTEWEGTWTATSGGKKVVKDVLKSTELLRGEVRRAVKADLDEPRLQEVKTAVDDALGRIRELISRG